MDSRAVQTHAHEYDQHHQNTHNVGSQEVAHGEEEHHHHDHEKKSVLKKVKQKAKKIKDTITKHGHHDHEHGHEYHYDDQHIPDDHDLDEEDDEDEDMDEDPEVHGAPIYDSAAVKSAAPGQVNALGKPGVNFGSTTVMGEETCHEPSVVVVSPTTGINQSRATDPTRTFVEGEKAVHPKVNLERPMHLEEDPHAPRSTPQAYAPANYQTKVTDPTGAGGAEIDITPFEKSFSRITVHSEPKPHLESKVLPTVAQTHYPSAGSHSQFAPELSTATNYPSSESYGQYMPELSSEVKTQYPKSHDQFMPELSTPTKTPYPSPKINDQHLPQQTSATRSQYPSSLSHEQFTPELSTEPKIQHPYTKIHDQHSPQQSSATKTQFPSAGSHDQFAPEFSAEPNIQYPYTEHLPQQSSATKTQYRSAGSHDQFLPEFSALPKTTLTFNTALVEEPHYEPTEKPSNESSYSDKISSATSAIADKAITAKNAMASKLGYGGDRIDNETTRQQEENTGNEKPSTISSATSAIADKAITAKNATASKLGYGNKTDTKTAQTRDQEGNTGNEKPSTISSATSAIADKAVSAKNTIGSKLGFGDTDSKVTTTNEGKNSDHAASPTEYGKSVAQSLTEKLAPVYGKVAGVGSGEKSKVSGTESTSVGVEQDKGVSVRDYLVDKLRPGDEDRALSEVISETLYKNGEPVEPVEVTEEGVRKVISDAVHKREEEPERRVEHQRGLGKVTESEEVKRRLGGEDEEAEKRYEEMYVNSPGKGVVDKLKGMVGSWFTGENQSSQGNENEFY
ncbi:Low-temperature-induced 65 kDa protein [Spatholobus suberectus]|nr:Low-temperature-induced 65 kDa protein [Spatholobus suberectus]